MAVWPDAQDRVSQEAAANKMAKANNERLNARAAALQAGRSQAPDQEPRKSMAEQRAEKRKEMTAQIRELESKQQDKLNDLDQPRGRGR